MTVFLQKLLLYSLPLRELAGFDGGITIRLGEIFIVLYIVFAFFSTSTKSKLRIFNSSKTSLILMILLLLNIIFSFVVTREVMVDDGFFKKYLIRNGVMFWLIISVVIRPFRIGENDLDKLFKYMILIQLLMFSFQALGYDIKFFNLMEYPPGRRFQGTASEAGYLPTLLAPALCYFRRNNNKTYYYLTFFMIFATFSSFGYFVLVLEVLILTLRFKVYLSYTNLLKFIWGVAIAMMILILGGEVVEEKVRHNSKKIMSYIKGEGYSYSVKSRTEQLEHIKRKIDESTLEERLAGNGTGRYSYIMMKKVAKRTFKELSEEAHTLYLATLYERGVIGLAIFMGILLSISYMIYHQRSRLVILSFGYLFFLQVIHWMITGNMWLYFFWIAAAYIVSSYEENYRMLRVVKERRGRWN